MMDSAILLWGLLFSSIGVGYFMYGKRKSNPIIRYTGVALIIYPYFVQNTGVLVLMGVALLLVPSFIKR